MARFRSGRTKDRAKAGEVDLKTTLEVKDGPWRKLMLEVEKARDPYVKVGVLASKGGGSEPEGGDISLIEIAAIHEFGSPAANIPERSFIRRTFQAKASDLNTVIRKLAGAVLTKQLPVKQALGLLGQWASAEVKKTITSGEHIPPPLKAATIARKGSDRPLVDTGRLVGAITYEIEDGGRGGKS